MGFRCPPFSFVLQNTAAAALYTEDWDQSMRDEDLVELLLSYGITPRMMMNGLLVLTLFGPAPLFSSSRQGWRRVHLQRATH